jgi:hypothetical protein
MTLQGIMERFEETTEQRQFRDDALPVARDDIVKIEKRGKKSSGDG